MEIRSVYARAEGSYWENAGMVSDRVKWHCLSMAAHVHELFCATIFYREAEDNAEQQAAMCKWSYVCGNEQTCS